jgi:hypothetical protein
MSGPSYINHYPAVTLYLLEQMSQHPEILHKQSMYGIIQGGMPYVHTHESGILALKLFCEQNQLRYQGGFVIGLGAMLDGKPLDKLIINGKKAKRNYLIFLNHISKDEISPEELYEKIQLRVPSIVLRLMARGMNKSIDKSLRDKGFDYAMKSPYSNL